MWDGWEHDLMNGFCSHIHAIMKDTTRRSVTRNRAKNTHERLRTTETVLPVL